MKQIGFSLIELMVVMVISSLLVGWGFSAYSSYSDRQILIGAGNQLYNDLRQTQGLATASDKPEGCSGVLEGYQLVFSNGSTYITSPICGSFSGSTVEKSLPSGLQLSVTSDTSAVFYILGKGAEAKNISIQGSGANYDISVSGSGEISDTGLVQGG